MAEGTPLQTGYTFWFMRRGKGAAKDKAAADAAKNAEGGENAASADKPQPGVPYESSIKTIATVNTVEEFWEVYNHLVRPNDLPTTTDYHFFREGIKPTWEDPSNAKGGKWIVRLRKGLASRYWEEIVLAILGQQFPAPDGEVCGAVISIRYSEDIISIWNKTSSDRDTTDRLRDAIKKVLRLPGHVHMEYKPHQASLADKSSFRNTQVWRGSRSRESGGGDGGGSSSRDTGGTGNPKRDMRRSGSWGDREEIRGGKARSGSGGKDSAGAWR
jgi:translation initiation factor 4E